MIRSTRNRLRSELNAARREIAHDRQVYLEAARKDLASINKLAEENVRLNDRVAELEAHNANLRAQLGQQLRNISDEKLLRRAIRDLHERLAELTRADHGHDLPVTADTGREVA